MNCVQIKMAIASLCYDLARVSILFIEFNTSVSLAALLTVLTAEC